MRGRIPKPLKERLLAKVDKTSSPKGCWLWTGHCGKGKNNYGLIGVGGRGPKQKLIRTNRASWIIFRGPIPEGMNVCHRCDNPRCVNPKHLFLGTQSHNMKDAFKKGRLGNRKGIHNTHSKISEADVLEIRRRYQRYKHGCKEALAKEFGLRPGTIVSIVRRLSWTHI